MSKKAKFFKKLTVKEQCVIAMLIAVTAVLSYISGYLRFGNIGKISISFVSVFVSGALFGPVIGGFVGAAADVISWLANPASGVFLWQLTAVEFVYGFLFGLFFWNKEEKGFPLRLKLCVLLQFASNIVIKTLVLMSIGYLPADFKIAVAARMPSCIVMLVLQIVLISVINRFMPVFKKRL